MIKESESMSYEKEIGARIRQLREDRRMSLRELGEAMQMDYSYIGRIERGFLPSTKVLRKIAEYFNVDYSFLLGEKLEIPKELEPHIKEWYSFIQESERRGYSPEDLNKILDTLDQIRNINKQ